MTIGTLILFLCALSAGAGTLDQGASAGKVPPVAQVQQRAVEHARLDPSEISSWKRRARYQALMPQLQLEYERRLNYDVDIDISDSVYVGSNGVSVGPEEGRYSQTQDADQNVAVKAVWRFNEAIFNPDMLNVSAETRHLARERQSLLAEVNRNYYDRSRLAGEIAYYEEQLKHASNPAKIRHEIYLRRVAFDEATAALDALTGGWFGEQLRDVIP